MYHRDALQLPLPGRSQHDQSQHTTRESVPARGRFSWVEMVLGALVVSVVASPMEVASGEGVPEKSE